MNAHEIANNETFVQFALVEALKILSDETGIDLPSLVEQFPHNIELQKSCATIVAETAKELAKKF